jgi:prepilin-type N-terminal cleavage/methylation domain-containing protein
VLPYHYGRMLVPTRRHLCHRGFTLVEIAVVLVILAVFMAMGAVMFRGFAAAQKRSITATRLATVDAALVRRRGWRRSMRRLYSL